MDLVHTDNNVEGSEEESAAKLYLPCYSGDGYISEDPKILPRVGEEYQAQVPPIILDYDQFTSCSVITQPVPIIWAHVDFNHLKRVEPLIINKNDSQSTLNDKYSFPGSLGESWSEIERESFVLGLYIFGKNLVLVKKFVMSREMGDVLSFYYGDFYRTDGYYRWSEFQKRRKKRPTRGHSIFSGGKLRELMTRLVRDESKIRQDELLEVSRTFADEKISLEEYIFTLKSAVGVTKLIEVVGIGRGMQDLTATTTKKKPVLCAQPKLPFGKACSSLSSKDIIKFLTGDFRLSKTRSNDLFWEAIWPRLLGRGWHSEEPKKDHHGVSSLKPHLVFIVPGVKKFSRRKLVKGEHYFDSVSDVMKKVALNPECLELETDSDEVRQDSEEQLIKKNFMPCNFNCIEDTMKFTIVDTSLFNGKEISMVRVLDISLCNESEQDILQGLNDEENDVLADRRGTSGESSECETIRVNDYNQVALNLNILAEEFHEGHGSDKDDQLRMTGNSIKYDSSKTLKCGQISYTASRHEESNSRESHETMIYHNLPSPSSSEKDTPKSINEGEIKKCKELDTSPQKKKMRTIIDLNIALPDIGIDEILYENKSSFGSETNQHSGTLNTLDDSSVHGRRQSTRNRPLTIKALQAIECGLSSPPKKKRKPLPKNKLSSRSFQNGHGNSDISSTFDDVVDNSIMVDGSPVYVDNSLCT